MIKVRIIINYILYLINFLFKKTKFSDSSMLNSITNEIQLCQINFDDYLKDIKFIFTHYI